jgi:signal transduction histidine kinase
MYLKTLTLFLLLLWSLQACSATFVHQYWRYKYQTIRTGHDYWLTFEQAKDHFEQTDEQRLKADRIISLLNKENKAKKLELQQEKATRQVLTDSAFLLLITILLVYLSFRNTQNANLLLDKKNRQLDTLNEQLMAGNRTKAKLLGIISHDLRSPVSQLFTFVRLQQNRPGLLTEACKNQYQQELLLSSANLLATMEDLLLWSKSQMDHFYIV